MFCINIVYSLLSGTSLKLEEMHGMTWPSVCMTGSNANRLLGDPWASEGCCS